MVGQCIAEWSRATRVSLLERVQVEVCQSRNWLVPVVVVVVVGSRPVSLHRAVTIPPRRLHPHDRVARAGVNQRALE